MARAKPGRKTHARDHLEAGRPGDQGALGYAGIGVTLRGAREEAGMSLADAATALRIQAWQLGAIEQGRFSDLPGQVYAIGYLRSYAEHLGFDGEAAVRRLKEELIGEDTRPGRLTFPVPVNEARQPGPRLLILAAVAAVAIYAAWAYWGHVSTGTAELVSPLPERLAKLVGESRSAAPAAAAAPTVVAPPAASVPAPASLSGLTQPAVASTDTVVVPLPSQPSAQQPATPPSPPAAVAAVSPPTPTPPPSPPVVAPPPVAAAPPPPQSMVAVAPVGAEVTPPPVSLQTPALAPPLATSAVAAAVPPLVPSPATAAPETASSTPQGQVYGASPAEARIVLYAKSISWVQVRADNNEIVMTRALKPGDTYLVPNRSDLTMMTGSAGGLEIKVDGKSIPPLGRVGEVRRNIPLDPDRLAHWSTPQ